MSTATDEQLLWAIVRQLDGPIDWQKVADECGITSKGAAAKRYSRYRVKFLQGGGDSPPSKGKEDGEEVKGKGGKKKAGGKKGAGKKRKIDEEVDDVEEGGGAGEAEEAPVKAEGDEA